jgi:SAM-dependent methyltransferase
MDPESPAERTDEAGSSHREATPQESALNARDFATQQTLRFIESVTEGRSNLRILEVGCGKGHLAKALVDRGHLVFPIDVSEEAVAFARSLGLPAKQTDIFGVNESAFDGILFIQSLHHINPLDQSLAQAALLLEKGGFVLLEEFAFNQVDEKTAVWFQGVQRILAGTGIKGFERVEMGEAFAHLMDYYSEHGIHTGEVLIRALRNVFPNVRVSEGVPYLYRYFVPGMESRPEGCDLIKSIFDWEGFQIKKGFIQGVGFRAVGFK